MAQDDRRKSNAALLSVASNTLLIILKLFVGMRIGSVSIISEAAHSSVDLLAAIIAFVAVRVSGRPADESHPFGHGKVENLSGTFEAILIFIAAIWILYEAAEKLRNPQPLNQAGLGILVMLISVAVNFFVSRRLYQVGEETNSVALKADACHLHADIYTSLGVLIGLAIIMLGTLLLPALSLYWVGRDSAIIVALCSLRAA